MKFSFQTSLARTNEQFLHIPLMAACHGGNGESVFCGGETPVTKTLFWESLQDNRTSLKYYRN